MKDLSAAEELELIDQFSDLVYARLHKLGMIRRVVVAEVVNLFADMGETEFFLMGKDLAEAKRLFYLERKRISHNAAAKAHEAEINLATAAAQFQAPVEAQDQDQARDSYSEAEG